MTDERPEFSIATRRCLKAGNFGVLTDGELGIVLAEVEVAIAHGADGLEAPGLTEMMRESARRLVGRPPLIEYDAWLTEGQRRGWAGAAFCWADERPAVTQAELDRIATGSYCPPAVPVYPPTP